MQIRNGWFLLVGVLAASGCSTAAAQSEPARSPAAVPDTAMPAAEATAHPGDMIRITIPDEPTWSGELTVPPSGIVVFPRIGPHPVTGRTLSELTAQLTAAYGEFLIRPAMHVEILRRVQVLGAVYRPDVYKLDANVTLSDAIAIAGGVTPAGRTDRVELRRDGVVVQVLLTQQTALADAPVRSGDQLFVPERPYVARNSGLIAAVVSGGIGLLITIITIVTR